MTRAAGATDAGRAKGLLADADVRGHVEILLAISQGPAWAEHWAEVGVPLSDFDTLGLPRDAPDAAVWETCQQRGLILITGNRNAESATSLEATIRTCGSSASLPVFTLAHRDRILTDAGYAHRVVARLMELLDDLPNLRGSGRLWLP